MEKFRRYKTPIAIVSAIATLAISETAQNTAMFIIEKPQELLEDSAEFGAERVQDLGRELGDLQTEFPDPTNQQDFEK